MLRKITFQFFAADAGGMGSMTAPAQPTTSSPAAVLVGTTGCPNGPEGAPGPAAAAQTAPVAQVQKEEESFESLIKGKYKSDYERSVKAAVSERLKGTKRTISKFSPILDVLGQQYGIDVSDPDKIDYDALTRRLTDDKRLYEAEAMEKGIPLETLMHTKQLERQNAALQRENAAAQGEMQRRAEFDRIVGQFAEVQAMYPQADLSQELANPDFGRLVSNGVPALTRRLTDDKRLYEAEAMEKGIPLETLMHTKQLERQNAALQRENAAAQGEMQRRAEFDRIVGQFAEVQAMYPQADLSQELANPDFGRLVSNGVPALTAYEVVHKAELAAARTRAVAQATQQQIVAGIQANGMRPPEGAANAGSGMPVQFDPRKLTKQQRDEIRARVNRGEKITF